MEEFNGKYSEKFKDAKVLVLTNFFGSDTDIKLYNHLTIITVEDYKVLDSQLYSIMESIFGDGVEYECYDAVQGLKFKMNDGVFWLVDWTNGMIDI